MVVEQHAAMRFAWLRKQHTKRLISPQQGLTNRILLVVYNLAWWLPILLSLFKAIDYRTGFIAFAGITAIRLVANLYRNNFLSLDQAESFPFRTP